MPPSKKNLVSYPRTNLVNPTVIETRDESFMNDSCLTRTDHVMKLIDLDSVEENHLFVTSFTKIERL